MHVELDGLIRPATHSKQARRDLRRQQAHAQLTGGAAARVEQCERLMVQIAAGAKQLAQRDGRNANLDPVLVVPLTREGAGGPPVELEGDGAPRRAAQGRLQAACIVRVRRRPQLNRVVEGELDARQHHFGGASDGRSDAINLNLDPSGEGPTKGGVLNRVWRQPRGMGDEPHVLVARVRPPREPQRPECDNGRAEQRGLLPEGILQLDPDQKLLLAAQQHLVQIDPSGAKRALAMVAIAAQHKGDARLRLLLEARESSSAAHELAADVGRNRARSP